MISFSQSLYLKPGSEVVNSRDGTKAILLTPPSYYKNINDICFSFMVGFDDEEDGVIAVVFSSDKEWDVLPDVY